MRLPHCGDEQSVFVPIVQCMQIPENPAVPSRVWLGSVDCFNRLWPRALYFSELVGFVFLGGIVNGVIGVLDTGRNADINQPRSEMIQGAAKILDCVTD
jgi:hypothetical protein